MDTERQIRLIIAPFFLFASLLLGAILSGQITVDSVSTLKPGVLVAIGSALTAATLPIGFLIGAVSISLLRLAFSLFTNQSYEAVLPQSSWEIIWPRIKAAPPIDLKKSLYAGVTLDHELLSHGVHNWITRRWNAFSISAHSCVALLLAHLVAIPLGILQSCGWGAATFVSVALLTSTGAAAWIQTMKMLEFQSQRDVRSNNRLQIPNPERISL